MSQEDFVLTESKQFAERLAMPVFIVNLAGDLVYCNEPAESILGIQFSKTGVMPTSEWSTKFHPVDQSGDSLPPGGLPLVIAITEHRPAHKDFWIVDLHGNLREIEVTALPLTGKDGQVIGGMAIFWEKAGR